MPNKRSERRRAAETRARWASPQIRISCCRRREEPEPPSCGLCHANRAAKLEARIKETDRRHHRDEETHERGADANRFVARIYMQSVYIYHIHLPY